MIRRLAIALTILVFATSAWANLLPDPGRKPPRKPPVKPPATSPTEEPKPPVEPAPTPKSQGAFGRSSVALPLGLGASAVLVGGGLWLAHSRRSGR
jgi:hypothetical protein